MPLPTEEEIERMHRYFAVECNNNAWELAELAERTDEQKEEMVRLAEVAAWHWSKVGTPINSVRAGILLSCVNAVAGRAEDARRHTNAVAQRLAKKIEGTHGWDYAMLALIETQTCLAEGNTSAYAEAYAQLEAAHAKLDDEEQLAFKQYRTMMLAP